MKILYLTNVFILLVFFGCSFTYKISDFPSKEKFYTDFNKFASGKSVKVTLRNDSSISVVDNAEIKDDSLYSVENYNITINKKITHSDLMEIKYTNKFNTSALILLKNGEKYQANHIETNNDSIYFFYDKNIITINKISSLDRLKNISYKNHWIAAPLGLFIGGLAGAALGLLGFINVNDKDPIPTLTLPNKNNDIDHIAAIFYGVVGGMAVGTVVGWIIGREYTYIFSSDGGNP